MKSIILLLVVCSLTAPGRADEPVFTVESAVSRALTNNADLAAARLMIEEARARVLKAGRWSNPELETGFMPNVRGREGSLSFGLSQRFPTTSRLRLEKNVSRAEVRVAEAEVREVERKLALEVRLSAVRLAALDAQLKLKTRQVENNRELTKLANEMAEVGQGSSLDVLQLALESGQLETERLKMNAEQSGEAAELALLLGISGTTLRIDEKLDPAALILETSAVTERPDLRASRARTASAVESIKLARVHRWEDAKFGVFAEVDRSEDAPNGIESDQMVGFQFSIPLPFWNKNEGGIAESMARMRRVEKEEEALSKRIDAETSTARQQMTLSAQLAKTIKENLLPKAQQVETQLTEFQKVGRARFTEVLRARDQRLKLESDEIAARRDFHLARARYLDARGIIQ